MMDYDDNEMMDDDENEMVDDGAIKQSPDNSLVDFESADFIEFMFDFNDELNDWIIDAPVVSKDPIEEIPIRETPVQQKLSDGDRADAFLKEIRMENIKENSHTTVQGWIAKDGNFDTDSADTIILNFCESIDYEAGLTCSTYKNYLKRIMSILKHRNRESTDKVKISVEK